MKTKFVIAIVCVIAILIGTISGYAGSEILFDKKVKGDFDLKEKIDTAKFEAKAESMDMTVEEFKTFLVEEFETKAQSMDMTVEEYKEYLAEQAKEKKDQYINEFNEKAQSMDMTV